jgi:hypothetical protein
MIISHYCMKKHKNSQRHKMLIEIINNESRSKNDK